MVKKKVISVIFLLLSFNLYSNEINDPGLFIYYRGLTWAIPQQEKYISIEENKNISSYINTNFMKVLGASSLFNIIDSTDSIDNDLKKAEKLLKFSIYPEITEFEVIESETSSLFLKISIVLTIENYDANDEKIISISAIGWGKNKEQAIEDSLKNIVNQFEYLIAKFEEWSDSFRIVDIYHETVVINSGKNRGIKKGDFLYSYDYHTGKKTGHFIIERTDEKLSYARILDVKKKPEPGDSLKPDNYIGISLKTYADYFWGDYFSGISGGGMLLFSRWLYTVNPAVGLSIFDVTDSEDNRALLITPYLGFRIVRYIKSFTLSSFVTLGIGYLSDSEIPNTAAGWEYFGGTVKAEVSKRIVKHLSLHIEGGYSAWFPSDYENYPNITGFLIGGGIGFKF